jgi:UDP-glucose 4-epimerase
MVSQPVQAARLPPSAADIAAAFDGARIMVTGGMGLIGSALAERLVGLGADVLIVDCLLPDSGGNPFNIADIRERVTVAQTDIRDAGRMRELLAGCRYVFNLAGQTSHLVSMLEPLEDLDINCRAQLTLLEGCRAECPDAVLVYAGTRQIYGSPRTLPVDESHPLHPVDVNGVNKMAAEAYHILYHEVYGLKASALRLTNTYGPRMRIKDARQTFVGVWLRALLEGRAFEVWGGEQLRDFTYVDDAVDAFLYAAIVPETHGRVFNIGGDPPVSLLALADMLIAAQGDGRYEIRAFPADRKRIDIGDYHADDRLFRAVTGWQPKVRLREGLERSLAYFRTHFAHYV